jgi:hypothetical protein
MSRPADNVPIAVATEHINMPAAIAPRLQKTIWPPADAVAEGSDDERPETRAEEPHRNHHSQAVRRDAPILRQTRGGESHREDIEAIESVETKERGDQSNLKRHHRQVRDQPPGVAHTVAARGTGTARCIRHVVAPRP